MIGNLGDIVFVTSHEKVFRPGPMNVGLSARFAKHQVIGRKPVLEFLGAETRTVSFSVRLDRSLGVDPLEELAKLERYTEEGRVLPLFIGEEALGSYAIESLSEDRRQTSGRGHLLAVEVSFQLTEWTE